ncbi:Abi family protein [Streptomyces albidoflavus]|uniref:Abi family protein n=1 Tax=Streptomyces albidoflavus TaxID=1886 RepID=UPI0034294723|nr:Abi family protein [Streptomyces albidoflavus]WSD57049.1 Abi family protein [Streptomyces albidoflavus]WTE00921.1 Abi family protein [Streptomyces albidoflavus]
MQIQPTAAQLKLMEPLISRPRLAPYLTAAGAPAAAMELYLWNVRLAAAFTEVIALAEIILRNAMAEQLAAAYGPTWYARSDLFDDRTIRGFQSTWRGITMPSDPGTGKPATKTLRSIPAGKMVAESTFGCWVNLLDKGGTRGDGPYRQNVDYDSTLWRKALHRAFPNSGGKRATVFTTASHVRSLRNRAAHHEPLLDGLPLTGQTDRRGRPRRLSLPDAHQEVLRLVEYVDKDVAAWLTQSSRVPQALAVRP